MDENQSADNLVAQYFIEEDRSKTSFADAIAAISQFTDAVSLIQAAVGEIDTKKEEAKKEIQDLLGVLGLGMGGEEDEGGFNLMALLRGDGKEGLAGKGGLGALAGLFGGLTGQGEGANPLEGMFASTYEKYLNGNGEDILGLIPTSEKALQDIQQAYEFALHGGGEDDKATMGILPAKDASLLEIDQSRNDTIRQIEAAGKKILSEIQDSVRRAIDGMIGHIARLVAGVIGIPVGTGGRGGSSGNYTA